MSDAQLHRSDRNFAMSVTPLPPGTELLPYADGTRRFAIIESIKAGGFGITYRATDRALSIEVVIKELAFAENMYRDPASRVVRASTGKEADHTWQVERFAVEAQRIATLSHPNVIRVYVAWQENGTAYYAMDYVDGATELGRSDEGTPVISSWPSVEPPVVQLLDALQYVHGREVFHFDIKPSNVLVDPAGQVKLIDFGASRRGEDVLKTVSAAAFTMGYAPPELMDRETVKEAGPWSDLYSWGMLVYGMILPHPSEEGAEPVSPTLRLREAMAGKDPYGDAKSRLVAAGVPEGAAVAISSCLALPIEARPKSAADVHSIAASASSARQTTRIEPIPAEMLRQTGPQRPVAQPRWRSKRLAWVIASLVVILLVALAFILLDLAGTSDDSGKQKPTGTKVAAADGDVLEEELGDEEGTGEAVVTLEPEVRQPVSDEQDVTGEPPSDEDGPVATGGPEGEPEIPQPVADERNVPDGFVLIEAGTFMMGSPEDEPGRDDDEIQHEVTITQDFFLQIHEVTQGQWQSLMGNNPSDFSGCGINCPVERVNWYEAIAYANALSDAEGLEVCYDVLRPNGTLGGGCPSDARLCVGDFFYSSVRFLGVGCEGYRLPTEAEWEYAARAGTATALHTGPIEFQDDGLAPALDPVAWYGGNSGAHYSGAADCRAWIEGQDLPFSRCGSHPVGRKSANGWGLYDMLGNVAELCWDRHGAYPLEPVTDPTGIESGANRAGRGASWTHSPEHVRSASRFRPLPRNRDNSLGFRLARSAIEN